MGRLRSSRALAALAALAATLGAFSGAASAQVGSPAPAAETASVPTAVDGILEAFARRPLVGLGDRHGLAQGHRFYEDVVRDARFARDVGNVVVEFGSAAHQATIDRYVNGESVPYPELRKVWMDAIGWIPTVQGVYFAHFFFQIRQTNAALPPESRIKVWLGEPPADWSKIETAEQWRAIADTRDAHAADLIVRNILAKNKKALVIYGAQHFEPLTDTERELFARHAAFIGNVPRNLQNRVQQDHPDTFFVAQTYVGFADADCQARFEEGLGTWTLPALRTPVIGTALERELRACLPQRTVPAGRTVPDDWPTELRNHALTHVDDHVLFEGDAILFLAPAGELEMGPYLADIYLDDAYRAEIDRRMKIMIGQPLPADYGRMIPPSMAFTQRDR
jgi:hypothetical protein